MRTRAERRFNDRNKALRKRRISRAVYSSSSDEEFEYYRDLHTYSKNKIHCSCPLCRNKTNGRKMNYSVISSSMNKGGHNYSLQDIKALEKLEFEKE